MDADKEVLNELITIKNMNGVMCVSGGDVYEFGKFKTLYLTWVADTIKHLWSCRKHRL